MVFFSDWQCLLEFPKALDYGQAALGDSVNDSVLLDVSLFNQPLFQKEIQVFAKSRAIDVSFVHDVR